MNLQETLNLLDVYEAPQGEGPYSGERTLFLRMSGCSVGCTWCDEAQTWKKRPNTFPIESLTLSLVEFMEMGVSGRVSITGGEPLENPEDLKAIIRVVRDAVPHIPISVETSGVYLPLSDDYEVIYILSPKPFFLPSYTLTNIWSNLVHRGKAHLKFVLGSLEDAQAFVKWMTLFQHHIHRFWVQPMYERKTPEFNVAAFQECYRLLWRSGLNPIVTLQIHKHLHEK